MSAIGEAAPRFDAHPGKFSRAGTFVLAGLAFVLHLPVIALISTLHTTNGRITENSGLLDQFSLAQQLGIIPAPG